MIVRYYLGLLAERLFAVASDVFGLAARVQNVWLLGQYLFDFLITAGTKIHLAAVHLVETGNAWDAFTANLDNRFNILQPLNILVMWSTRLAELAGNFGGILKLEINRLYPVIQSLTASPLTFLRPYIRFVFEELGGAVQDVFGVVFQVLSTVIPDFDTLRTNPAQWILANLTRYSGLTGQLLSNPDGFIRQRINLMFPQLAVFLADPDNFILEKVINGFERFFRRFQVRILKIAENVLNEVF